MPKIPKVILRMDTARQSDRDFLRGIIRYADVHGPWEFYFKPFPYLRDDARTANQVWFKKLDADGIMMRGLEGIKEIRKTGIPAVVSGIYREECKGVHSVRTDSVSIGCIGAEHLLGCGLVRFAYCGFGKIEWSKQRCTSFVKRINEEGFTVSCFDKLISGRLVSWDKEKRMLINWLCSLPKLVGLMVCNDDRGLQVLEACKIAGIRIPEDLAVISVDNDELICTLTTPSLSSIHLNFEKGGYEAAHLLDKLMKGRMVKQKAILVEPVKVVCRHSTDIVAIGDEDVAAAVRFIRQNSNTSLCVDDIVSASNLGRRVLERRFRKFLRRSIAEEIRRVRVELVSRLLIETNMSVSRIAAILNYPDKYHIARYFAKEKGLSPLAYRKRNSFINSQ